MKAFAEVPEALFFQAFGAIIDYFSQKTQLDFYYNYLLSHQPAEFNYYIDWIQKAEVRSEKRGRLINSSVQLTGEESHPRG